MCRSDFVAVVCRIGIVDRARDLCLALQALAMPDGWIHIRLGYFLRPDEMHMDHIEVDVEVRASAQRIYLYGTKTCCGIMVGGSKFHCTAHHRRFSQYHPQIYTMFTVLHLSGASSAP